MTTDSRFPVPDVKHKYTVWVEYVAEHRLDEILGYLGTISRSDWDARVTNSFSASELTNDTMCDIYFFKHRAQARRFKLWCELSGYRVWRTQDTVLPRGTYL